MICVCALVFLLNHVSSWCDLLFAVIPFLLCPRTVIDCFFLFVCLLGVIAAGICWAVVILVKDLIFMVLLLAFSGILVEFFCMGKRP